MIKLAGYGLQNQAIWSYQFDPETGYYTREKLLSPQLEFAGCVGFAQLLRSPQEGSVLVATYLLDGEAWISIGRERWKRFDPEIVVVHSEVGRVLPLCELSLHRSGDCQRKFRYYQTDWLLALIGVTYDYLDYDLANLPVSLDQSDIRDLSESREVFIRHWSSRSSVAPTSG